MRVIKKLLFFLFLLFANRVYCQKLGPINTDRPDQSDGVYTLPRNIFQLETGWLYGDNQESYFLHNTMLRYGLFPKTELRLELDYGKQYKATGIMPVDISVKRGLTEQNGLLPAITAVGHIGLPFLSTRNFRSDKASWGLTFAFENDLSEKFGFAYNLGTFSDGESDQLNWLGTFELGFSPSDKVSFFLEYFATFTNNFGPDHNLDAGILWLLKNNLQIDLAAGTSIFKNTEVNRFITTGLSYRFHP